MGWNWKNQVREFVQQCARDDHGCLKHSCQSWVPKKEKLSHPFVNSMYPVLGKAYLIRDIWRAAVVG